MISVRYGFLQALGIVAALTFYLQRIGVIFFRPYLYAEDGAVFLQEQALLGARAVFVPFAGYLHLVPRLTALFASAFSAVHAPEIYEYADFLMMVWAVVTVASVRLNYSWLLAILLFAVPHRGEVFGTITNAQWVMACALPLIAMTPTPLSRTNRVNQIGFCLLSAFSGPISVFAAPFYLLAWRMKRDRHAITLTAVVGLAAAVQIMMMLGSFRPAGVPHDQGHLAITILDRWFGSLAHGWRSENPGAALAACLYAIAVFGLAWFSSHRYLNIALLSVACAILGTTALKFSGLNPHEFDWPDMDDRYFYVPKVAAFWILAGALHSARMSSRIVAACALCATMFALHSHGFDWWTKYVADEKPWRSLAKHIDDGAPVTIPIFPDPYEVALPARADL